MKNNKFLIIFLVLVVVIILFFIFFNMFKNNTKNDNFVNNQISNNSTISKTSFDVNVLNSNNNNNNNNNNSTNNLEHLNTTQTEISSFSTIIMDSEEGRINNLNVTCNAITGTIISPNETFSFNDTVGKPSENTGYKEATVIINHKSDRGVGGGNCQISSTLYNAVLNAPGLEIVERHEHGKNVGYVPEGQDATVSYGSLDFKFINNNDYKIKLDAQTVDGTVIIKLYKVID